MSTIINNIKKHTNRTIVFCAVLYILSLYSFLVQMAIEENFAVPRINRVYYTISNFDENAFISKIDTLKSKNIIKTVEIENSNIITSYRKGQCTIYSLDDNIGIAIYDSDNNKFPAAVSFNITTDFGLLTGESIDKLKLCNYLLDGTCECDKHIILNILKGISIVVLIFFPWLFPLLAFILLLLWLYEKSIALMKRFRK